MAKKNPGGSAGSPFNLSQAISGVTAEPKTGPTKVIREPDDSVETDTGAVARDANLNEVLTNIDVEAVDDIAAAPDDADAEGVLGSVDLGVGSGRAGLGLTSVFDAAAAAGDESSAPTGKDQIAQSSGGGGKVGEISGGPGYIVGLDAEGNVLDPGAGSDTSGLPGFVQDIIGVAGGATSRSTQRADEAFAGGGSGGSDAGSTSSGSGSPPPAGSGSGDGGGESQGGSDDANGVLHEQDNDDGSTTTVYNDGTIVTASPDGTVEISHPDGTTETTLPDGTHIEEYPDGSSSTVHPDGTVTETPPDDADDEPDDADDEPDDADDEPDDADDEPDDPDDEPDDPDDEPDDAGGGAESTPGDEEEFEPPPGFIDFFDNDLESLRLHRGGQDGGEVDPAEGGDGTGFESAISGPVPDSARDLLVGPGGDSRLGDIAPGGSGQPIDGGLPLNDSGAIDPGPDADGAPTTHGPSERDTTRDIAGTVEPPRSDEEESDDSATEDDDGSVALFNPSIVGPVDSVLDRSDFDLLDLDED